MSNKIVTSVSALTDDNVDNISDNNVVCIDIEQGRIGVHTSNPTCEIDVSGVINCNILRINNVPINPTGTVDFENMETSLIPLDTNTYTIGSVNKLWSTAHINEAKINELTVLSSTNRLYQEIKGDISWNAVNGYYGLAKNAYPALDPISYGGTAVSNWTPVSLPESCYGICWSPELRIFVVVAYTNFLNNTNQVMTSRDGINWNIHSTSIEENTWQGVCWSPELKIFVAVGSGSNGIMTSTNGINWQAIGDSLSALSVCWSPELGLFVAIGESNVIISPDGSNWTSIQIPAIEYNSVCWSPELGIFVAVGVTGNNNGVITSSDGINWTSRTTPDAGCNNVCWSSELGIFVAVAGVTNNINTTIMTSSNGINWTIATTGNPSLTGVCWCPQLRIFVAVGPYSVMTSANGTTWFVDILAFANNGPSYANIGSTNISWSPELGIFVAPANGMVMRSSLKGRPPTSYNVFDSSFNSIDEQGMWTFSNVTIRDSITFPSNSISSSNIADLNVTEGKIGALAVTEGKIGALAVTEGKIGALAVTEGKIGALAVTEGKIGALAVTEGKIATGTITEAKLASALQTKLNAKANLAGPTTFTGAIVLPSTTTIGNVSSTELGYIAGVTSSIQNQFTTLSNDKAPSASPSFSGTITIPSGANILSANVSVTSEQLAFVNGATSNIQNQLTNLSNNKAPSDNPTFTGTVVLPASTINSTHIIDGTITELKLVSAVRDKLNTPRGCIILLNNISSLNPIEYADIQLNINNSWLFYSRTSIIGIGNEITRFYKLPATNTQIKIMVNTNTNIISNLTVSNANLVSSSDGSKNIIITASTVNNGFTFYDNIMIAYTISDYTPTVTVITFNRNGGGQINVRIKTLQGFVVNNVSWDSGPFSITAPNPLYSPYYIYIWPETESQNWNIDAVRFAEQSITSTVTFAYEDGLDWLRYTIPSEYIGTNLTYSIATEFNP